MGDLELYHYGVPGMKWGVRRLNRVNTRTEAHQVARDKTYRYTKHKNAFVRAISTPLKIEGAWHDSRYRAGKKKVDKLIKKFDEQGVTLTTLKKRKRGVAIGVGIDTVARWEGVKYVPKDAAK